MESRVIVELVQKGLIEAGYKEPRLPKTTSFPGWGRTKTLRSFPKDARFLKEKTYWFQAMAGIFCAPETEPFGPLSFVGGG